MKTTSKWFVAYNLGLIACALSCQIYLTIARDFAYDRGLSDGGDEQHAELVRIVDGVIPPGWTADAGIYLALISDPAGVPRARAFLESAPDGHLVLVAAPAGPDAHAGALTRWDPADRTTPERFGAWLAGITAGS